MGDLVETKQQPMQMPVLTDLSNLPASVIESAHKATAELLTRVWAAQAVQFDTEAAWTEILEMCGSKSFSERALYCVAVGKDKDTGKQNYAEGPSIHLAMEIYKRMPNVGLKIIEHGTSLRGDQIEVRTMNFKLLNSYEYMYTVEIPKWASHSDTSKRRYKRSAIRKDIRDAIFDLYDRRKIDQCFEKARSIQDRVCAELVKQKEQYIADLAQELGIKPQDLVDFCKKKSIEDIKAGDIRRIRALKVAMVAGDIDPQDIWQGANSIFDEDTNGQDDADKLIQEKSVKATRKIAKDEKVEPPTIDVEAKEVETASPAGTESEEKTDTATLKDIDTQAPTSANTGGVSGTRQRSRSFAN